MDYLSSLLLIAGVYALVLASPGPNFFILSQMALDGRRREARYVVAGLTTGSVFWVVLALAGVATVMSKNPNFAAAIKVLGAAYLVWYGIRLLRTAFRRADQRTAPPWAADRVASVSAYRLGLVTGVTNPKGAVFWTSAFAALFPVNAPTWFYFATVMLVAILSLIWHIGITVVFGIRPLRAGYLRIERGVNAFAGGALVLLGLNRLTGR